MYHDEFSFKYVDGLRALVAKNESLADMQELVLSHWLVDSDWFQSPLAVAAFNPNGILWREGYPNSHGMYESEGETYFLLTNPYDYADLWFWELTTNPVYSTFMGKLQSKDSPPIYRLYELLMCGFGLVEGRSQVDSEYLENLSRKSSLQYVYSVDTRSPLKDSVIQVASLVFETSVRKETKDLIYCRWLDKFYSLWGMPFKLEINPLSI